MPFRSSAGVSQRPWTSDLTEKDLAMRRWKVADVLQGRIDGFIAQFREIVRLPIIARARRQQRVEGLLPGAIRLHADEFPQRLSEMPHRLDRLSPGLRVAGVKERKRDDPGAVHLRRKKRKRGGLAKHRPDRGLLALSLDELTVLPERRGRLLQGIHDQAAQHAGAERVKPEFESRDDAEIPAASPQGPEQIRVLFPVRPHETAVCGDHVHRQKIIDRHAMLAREPSEPPAEREAGDPGRGVDAERGGKSEGLRLGIEVPEGRSGLDMRHMRPRIDADRAHAGKVDHQPPVAYGVAGDVMPSSFHGGQQAVGAGEVDRQLDVTDSRTADDQGRSSVDHGVPYGAGLFVAVVSR